MNKNCYSHENNKLCGVFLCYLPVDILSKLHFCNSEFFFQFNIQRGVRSVFVLNNQWIYQKWVTGTSQTKLQKQMPVYLQYNTLSNTGQKQRNNSALSFQTISFLDKTLQRTKHCSTFFEKKSLTLHCFVLIVKAPALFSCTWEKGTQTLLPFLCCSNECRNKCRLQRAGN